MSSRPPTYVTLARMTRALDELSARLAGHQDARTSRLVDDLRDMVDDVQTDLGRSS